MPRKIQQHLTAVLRLFSIHALASLAIGMTAIVLFAPQTMSAQNARPKASAKRDCKDGSRDLS